MIALIDGDILAYEKAAGAEDRFDWNGDGKPSQVLKKDLDDVCAEVERSLRSYARRLGALRVVVCLSDLTGNYFRKALYPFYKGNRVGTVKPLLLKEVKAYLLKEHQAYERPGLEADDVLGILATHPTLMKGEKVIVSKDKDLATIPGNLFNPDKDSEPRCISEPEADWNHLYQTLVGDTTDGYPGCPGIGPKRARDIVGTLDGTPQSLAASWKRIVAAYARKKLPEQYALNQARIARICRASDYDFDKKEAILWNPPTAPA